MAHAAHPDNPEAHVVTPAGHHYGLRSASLDETLEVMAKDAAYFEDRARDTRAAMLAVVRERA